MKSQDVVIVGAGLAGLYCARTLGRAGVQVLLVDRKASPERPVHTTGIFVRRTLEDFDLPEDCLGPPVRRVHLYSPARRVLTLESPHDEYRVGRMGPLYRHYLEDCQRSGVTWAPGTLYAGCEEAGQDTLVRLRTDGQDWTVRTRYLVGADGAGSRVARDLGLDSNREWIVGVEEVLEPTPLSGPPAFHCFLDPTLAPGYIAWLVQDGVETHVGVGGYPGRFDPLAALERFRASLSDRVDLHRARVIERRGGRIPVGGVLRRLAHGRGLLVGDAAGAVSPLTAGGLDPCLRLSSLAGQVIVDYLRSEDLAALAPYCGRRFRARFRRRLAMRRVLAAVQSPVLLEVACGALRTPLLRPLAWRVFFGRGSFPSVAPELLPGRQMTAWMGEPGALPWRAGSASLASRER